MSPKSIAELTEKVTFLEEKIAHQEYTIDALNSALVSQQQRLDEQDMLLQSLREKIKSLANVDGPSADQIEIPPHY